jgi:hypothetical protein
MRRGTPVTPGCQMEAVYGSYYCELHRRQWRAALEATFPGWDMQRRLYVAPGEETLSGRRYEVASADQGAEHDATEGKSE